MNFIEAIKREDNFTTTTNGAVALKSTQSSLVDLFGTIGALRNASESEIEQKFIKAFSEDNLLAMKMLFYARDVRSGLGERRVFRTIIKYLAKVHPLTLKLNLKYVSEFGRWDDLFVLLDTDLKQDVINLIHDQLQSDLQSDYPSLLAKWLKSENTSSKESVVIGKTIREGLKLSQKDYRKTLSKLRAKIRIVETAMSSGQWTEIEYSKVPSRAMMIYRNAFKKHDEDGFANFIESLQKGETKINASTLYPYDLLEKMCSYGSFYLGRIKHDLIIEEQWKALPNYIDEENNILIMADTSGSMSGRPMATSVGLAIYFAERNKGIFKDVFMTFSSTPSFITLKGTTLYEKIRCVPEIVSNTNLEAAFDLILKTAINNNLNPSDMPKSLVVISDMQFDQAQGYNTRMTFYDTMVNKYNSVGYEMPNVIFWNVNNPKDTFQVTSDYKGVQLASGQSPSVFKSILANIGKTPYEAMESTLNTERYNVITI